MNNTIVHPVEFVVKQDVRPARMFRAGFDAYCRGLRLDDLTDPAARRGWWAALDAAAYAAVADHAAARGRTIPEPDTLSDLEA